jgi:hypothetical protein
MLTRSPSAQRSTRRLDGRTLRLVVGPRLGVATYLPRDDKERSKERPRETGGVPWRNPKLFVRAAFQTQSSWSYPHNPEGVAVVEGTVRPPETTWFRWMADGRWAPSRVEAGHCHPAMAPSETVAIGRAVEGARTSCETCRAGVGTQTRRAGSGSGRTRPTSIRRHPHRRAARQTRPCEVPGVALGCPQPSWHAFLPFR